MRRFSFAIACFYGLGLVILIGPNGVGFSRSEIVFDCIYGALTIGTGWAWLTGDQKIAGWIHGFLMLGVAAACIVPGWRTLNDRSIAGGHGPDANPAEGIVYAVAWLQVMGGLPALVAGVGVLLRNIAKKPDGIGNAVGKS